MASDSGFEVRMVDWLTGHRPDASQLQIGLIAGLAAISVLCGLGYRRMAEKGKKERPGVNGAFDALGEGTAAAVGALGLVVWRFCVGEPMWGEAKTDATFLGPGDSVTRAPMNEDSPTGETFENKDAPRRFRLAALLLLRGRSVGGADLLTRTWHSWPGAVRASVRLSAVAVAVGFWLGPLWTVACFAGIQLIVLVVIVASHRGGRGRKDARRYGPGLWGALIQVLRLSAEDQKRGRNHWMSLSDDLSSDRARVVIRLPLFWLGSEKERAVLAHVVHSRLPGQWVAAYAQRGRDPYVEFTPRPPAPPEPELPTLVEWIRSDDPARVYVGETFQGPRYVDTETETPHWGISGGTGDGKTTVLLLPVVHGRQHGALVDCITMKAAAFKDIEGESGIRVHKSGRQAVAAMAEFYVSMKAAESLQGTPEVERLPGRILVIDEFASFVKSAKIWWRYGLQAKGMPPFEAWFHMILMQGRSANHKIVVGAHTFTRELFGDTETRDLVGTKGIVGPASNPKWGVTYGLDAPRVAYKHEIKGRGVIGVTGSQAIEEIQYAYITPYAREYLRQCAAAPSWHAAGEMAPWITPEALKEAEDELAIADFLPGGAFMRGATLVTKTNTRAVQGPAPRSERVASNGKVADVTGGVTTYHDAYHQQADQSEETKLPVFSLKEACETGILPVRYDAARQRMTRARKAGQDLPEGITVGGATYYTAKELVQWWTLMETLKRPSPAPSM
ncbi:type IV secretory system conjugative DNA transfer family protein [Streptomyces yokosukanensis]|nr:type IV secretory system conjugative DNA transfer family protein [Streptomyces yokosukanensis]